MNHIKRLLFQQKTVLVAVVFLTGVLQTAGIPVTDSAASDEAAAAASVPSAERVTGSMTLNFTSTDESCPGAMDGSIDLTIADAETILTINWTNGATTEDLSGLTAGTYEVAVADADETQNLSITIGNSNPSPSVSISGNATACQNSDKIPFTISASGGLAPYVANFKLNGGLELQSQPFTDEITMYQSTTNTGTYHYELISVLDANNCAYPVSGEIVIEVTSGATVDVADVPEFCQGEHTPVIPLSGTPDNVVFDITGGAAIGLGDKTGVTQIPSFTALTGSATLTVTPRANGCSGTPETVQVTVSPKADLSVSQILETICSGETTNIKLSSTTAGATFSWEVQDMSPAGSISGATNDNGTMIVQTLVNTGTEEATVTYRITSGKNGCEGSSLDVTVRVYPEVHATISKTTNNCQDETSPEVIFSATDGQAPYTFTYRVNGGTDQTVTLASGNSISIPVPTANAGELTFELITVEDQTGCPHPVNESVIVRIFEKPVLTSGLRPTGICSNEVFTYNPTSQVPGTTFNWTRDLIAGIRNPAATGNANPDEYLENTTNDPIPVTYTYTLTTTEGCVNTEEVIVIVTKTPELTSSLTPPDICSGTTFSYTPTSDISGTDYPWTRAAVPGISNPSSSGTGNPNEILTNTTSSPIGVTYLYTLISNGCENPVIYPVYVVVIPAPKVTASASETAICPGEGVTLFSSSDAGTPLPETLIAEDFNSGNSGDRSGPNGWTTTYNNSNAAWTIRDDSYSRSGKTFRSNDNSKFFLANSDNQYNTRSELISPPINTTGYTSLTLSFWQYYRNGGNSDHPRIQVSTDQNNWTTIEELTTDKGNSSDFANYSVSLNGYVGQAALFVRFYFEANDDYYWAIDNVTLTGEGNATAMFWTSDPAGFTSTEANPTEVYPTETTDYIAWYTDPDTGCLRSDTVTVIVRESPRVTIEADYCSDPGKIILTASGASSYLWMTGETTSSITVDVAGNFFVTGTDQFGCSNTASFNTATELVVNGDFELGEAGRTTFYTDYGFRQPSGSLGGGLYGIGKDSRPYYGSFRGAHDHTSGDGYYMIVDGTESSKVVWQQTIAVQANTTYYFSAWAMNIYLISKTGYNPHLQFSINGQLIGTDVLLNEWTNSDTNPWLDKFRFWGEWNSGSATTAVVQIRDLETSYQQNDFGLDDISFGTLAPRPAEVAPSSSGDACEGGDISLYAHVSYGREPITFLWTGPNGFSSTEENPLLSKVTAANSGTYTVQAFDAYGCANESGSVSLKVFPAVEVNAGPDQEVCYNSPQVSLTGSVTGGATSGSWSGGSGTFGPDAQTLTTSYTPSEAEIAAGFATLTLTSDTPGGPCPVKSDQLTITINQPLEVSFSLTVPLCHGGNDGQITATVAGGQAPYAYLWNDGQTTQTAIGLRAGTYSVTITDKTGCSVTESVTLSEPSTFIVNPPVFTAPGCYGGTDGSATITATGGTPPYEFIWDAAANSQTTSTAANLGAGTYSVVVLSDSHGCAATAVKVTVPEPEAPELSCPNDIYVLADEGQDYASNVTVPAPEYDSFCQAIDYEMTGATSGSDDGLVPSPSTFKVGTTTITYTAVNLKGELLQCSFRVIVSDTKPEIDCNDPVSVSTDANQCDAAVTVSLPEVNAGTGITWSWEMTGATEASGTGSIPTPYTFKKGVTTIVWTATNAAGSAQCTQTVTVTDQQPPEFVSPDPVEVCVDRLIEFTYTRQNIPDYGTFEKGNRLLDLNPSSFTDNCGLGCDGTIEWRVVFSDGSQLPASGYNTGQPSTYGSDFRFPGDSTNDLELTHTVYYRLTDCSGNTSDEVSTTVTVIPRAKISSAN
ncbi:SprB repeat-containing protein [Mangrovibacterium lignilyticum]|uniref:SprB repeat-containing protein n=1 Tax=Mangrovibacterium lignilyticum TaxID=2668052 RepID=UPI0013D1C66A|nr:SprB repeat-containing protein [Mangrovibacterium lignilyticum]